MLPILQMQTGAPVTRASLLLCLRDLQNAEAWEQFVEIYTPLVYNYCRCRGLQDADAADVTQDVMQTVARAIKNFEYDRERGLFRNWLLTVVRSKLNNFLAKQQRLPNPAGHSAVLTLAEGAASVDGDSRWEAEYHQHLFHWVAGRIRPQFEEKTWTAFWRAAIEEEDGKKVAASLGMSLAAVYVAKSRVLARLKTEFQSVDGEEVFRPNV